MAETVDRGRPWLAPLFVGAIGFAALTWISQRNYLLFHSLVELFSVVVGACLFLVAWHSRHRLQNGYFAVLAMAYLPVSAIDLAHTLAYKGMGVFPWATANLPTQLWIAARATEASALVLAPVFAARTVSARRALWAYGALGVALLAAIFAGVFPACFVEGRGLTPFKKGMEYAISGTLVLAAWGLLRRARFFDRTSLAMLVAATVTTVFAELAFTFYVSVFGLSNLVGHLLKFVSFWLVYLVLVRTAIEEPVDLLFAQLKRREAELSEEKARLQQALEQVRTLEGLIPICSGCKKIRDDKGYWREVELYVRERTGAEFTHGLCPDCVERLYPEFAGQLGKHRQGG
ncbi:MASE3 domain-containing protein [Deferrisoma palaeochoriense]